MKILCSNNPLDLASFQEHQAPDNITPNQAIETLNLKLSDPYILLVDGEAWGRDSWDNPLPDGGVIVFVEIPRGWVAFFAVLALVAVGASVYMASMMSPTESKDMGRAKTVYSFSTGRNRLRIGEPFAENFGRVRIFPDLAQQSYIRNGGHEQNLYFLGILGVGEYDVEGVYIENTPLTDYASSSYNILKPGDTPTLVPDVVWTCNEVGNQELKEDLISYIVSPTDTEAYFIEYDVSFPAGLIEYNSEGERRNTSVRVMSGVRKVDNYGNGISDWVALDDAKFTDDSKNPRRYSRKIAAPLGPGRYQIRIRRANNPSRSSKVMDKAILSGLRGYGGPHPDYGNVTMIEARIKASNQLNGDAASQINVVATRKLHPVTSTGFGASLVATRSIADICAYIVTSENGGRQDDSIIDWSTLYDLRTEFADDDYYFDYSFNGPVSVMDACTMATACGRAIPCMPGGLFSVVRDELQALPACVFTKDNITDLTITTRPRTPDSQTCINVTYVNPVTWDGEAVTCIDGNGSEDNPSEISLDGCTSRQHAYEIGMFLYNQDRLERTSVEFSTGLIGHIPALLSKVVVPNTMIDWGQDGLIMAVDGTNIWLSEPVDFCGQAQGAIYISKADGSSGGPYTVTPTEDTHCVQGSIPELLPLSSNGLKATRYLFGPAANTPMFIRVGKIQPQGRDRVKISGTLIDDGVYDDPGAAPPVGAIIGAPDLLAGVSLSSTGENTYVASWTGSASKFRIELDEGAGYTILQDLYSGHAEAFTSTSKTITVRVTPYDASEVLQSGDAMEEYYFSYDPPTGLAVVSNDNGVYITWDTYVGADSYDVSIWVDGVEVLAKDTTETNASATMQEMELVGGPWDVFTVYLSAMTSGGQTEQASLTHNVLALDAPDEILFQARFENGVSLSWDAVTGAVGYVVCHSDTTGFTPLESNVVYRGNQPAAIIGGLSMAGEYSHYFRVAALTGYDDDIASLNYTSELEILPETSVVSILRPDVIAPANGTTGISVSPTVTISPFYSLYGIAQQALNIQISKISDFTTKVVNVTLGAVSGYEVTDIFDYETDYYIRARYQDSNGTWSGWSTTCEFTTKIANANIVGVALRTTGGGGGTWEHIDVEGETITTPSASWFNSHPIWGNIEDVTVDGQAMVQIPKFYYRRGTASNGDDAYWISDQNDTGFSVMPAFVLDGSEVDEIQVGKYQASESGGKLRSVSGVMPKVSTSRTTFISLAEARNTGGVEGFRILHYRMWLAIQWLYLIEKATMDCQTETGAGRIYTYSAASVSATDVATATYRGMVGLWGNVYQTIDGLKVDSTDEIQRSDYSDTWESTGISIPDDSDNLIYPITFLTGTGVDEQFIADTFDSYTLNNGTIPDYRYWYNGIAYPYVGGYWSHSVGAGLWCLRCQSSNPSGTNIGSRLARIV